MGANPAAQAKTRLTPARRERLILDHLPLVEGMVAVLRRQIPACVEVDELRSAGQLALVESVDRYQEHRGVTFGAFVRMRVRGAMLDLARRRNYQWTHGVARVEEHAGGADQIERDLLRSEHLRMAWHLVDELPRRPRAVIRAYYRRGWPLWRIGRYLSPPVNESRSCQILKHSLAMLVQLARDKGVA